MDVRAVVAVQAGKPLEIITAQLDGPRAGEVLVEAKATGICHGHQFTWPPGPDGSRVKALGLENFHMRIADNGMHRTVPANRASMR
ncbi:hypothetical protein ASC96_30250 [Rhizobium sp. Root1204]|nr:hypothetical protein ASC96_30250 [Rhizobium sp. Root1204]